MVIRRASNVPLGMADAGSCNNNLFVKYVCDSTLICLVGLTVEGY